MVYWNAMHAHNTQTQQSLDVERKDLSIQQSNLKRGHPYTNNQHIRKTLDGEQNALNVRYRELDLLDQAQNHTQRTKMALYDRRQLLNAEYADLQMKAKTMQNEKPTRIHSIYDDDTFNVCPEQWSCAHCAQREYSSGDAEDDVSSMSTAIRRVTLENNVQDEFGAADNVHWHMLRRGGGQGGYVGARNPNDAR